MWGIPYSLVVFSVEHQVALVVRDNVFLQLFCLIGFKMLESAVFLGGTEILKGKPFRSVTP